MKCNFSRLPRAAFLGFACWISSALADTASVPYEVHTLSWAAPAANEDGSPLTDLAGYYIYTGDSPDTLVPHYFSTSGKLGMAIIYPPGGAHYFAVTAINVDGVESALTPVVGR